MRDFDVDCVAVLLHIICFTKINWGYIHKLTINKPTLLIIVACNQNCHYCKHELSVGAIEGVLPSSFE